MFCNEYELCNVCQIGYCSTSPDFEVVSIANKLTHPTIPQSTSRIHGCDSADSTCCWYHRLLAKVVAEEVHTRKKNPATIKLQQRVVLGAPPTESTGMHAAEEIL